MTIYWPNTTAAQRIEAIKSVWFLGASASYIGAAIGISRNAVIGMYSRHREALNGHPLGGGPTRAAQASRNITTRTVSMTDRPIPDDIMREANERFEKRLTDICLTWDHAFGMMDKDDPRRSGMMNSFRQVGYHVIIPEIARALMAGDERAVTIARDRKEFWLASSGAFSKDIAEAHANEASAIEAAIIDYSAPSPIGKAHTSEAKP